MVVVVIHHRFGELECEPFKVNKIPDNPVDVDLPLPETAISE